MTPQEIRKYAYMMGVSYTWAVDARIRFLSSELQSLGYEDCVLPLHHAFEYAAEIAILRSSLVSYKVFEEKEITDDMIAAARAYPINKLIEFKHGKARAPCHTDKRPSMFHATRTNRACCPVCDKSWDTIGWLMDIEGRTFRDAVRELQ